MPKRARPLKVRRSEHWLRTMVNLHASILDAAIIRAFNWHNSSIDWRSPLQSDQDAEYYDQSFLDRLGVTEVIMPLREFWPRSGPRWDGLACTSDGKLILIEAKAHIDEMVTFRSKASPETLLRIEDRLEQAKEAFHASKDACWHTSLYQMANRLAHLYYLAGINGKDAYLVFIDFANAPDVPEPVSCEEWQGAVRLAHKSLGLKESKLSRRVITIIVDLKNGNGHPSAYVYPPSKKEEDTMIVPDFRECAMQSMSLGKDRDFCELYLQDNSDTEVYWGPCWQPDDMYLQELMDEDWQLVERADEQELLQTANQFNRRYQIEPKGKWIWFLGENRHLIGINVS